MAGWGEVPGRHPHTRSQTGLEPQELPWEPWVPSLGENSVSGAPHPISRLTALPLSLSPHQQSLIELLLRTRRLQGTEDAPGKQTAPALMELDSSAGRETPLKREQLRVKQMPLGMTWSRALGWRWHPLMAVGEGEGSGKSPTVSAAVFSFFFFVGLVYLTRPPKIMSNSPIGLLRGGGGGWP